MKYEKPILIPVDECPEGVYMASGAVGNNCYSVSAYIHQMPETGRGDFRIQLNGVHAAADSHHSGEQVLVITFNQPVTYKSSNGALSGGDGTSTLRITYQYHNNGNDNIGLGDLVVESDAGLAVTGAMLECNYDCRQHTW